MPNYDWIYGFPGAITVCDLHGTVLEMNKKSAELYVKYGGKELISKNLLDCHPEAARNKLLHLLESGDSNVYTTENGGNKKLIYQAPWFCDGERCGMVELALEIPTDLPNFRR
jgi:hypothetical protein